jgi:hypothetical protein
MVVVGDEVQYASCLMAGLQTGRSDGPVQTVELAIPARPDLGLVLKRGKQVGLMFYVSLPDRGPIALFEPYHIFDSTLQ